MHKITPLLIFTWTIVVMDGCTNEETVAPSHIKYFQNTPLELGNQYEVIYDYLEDRGYAIDCDPANAPYLEETVLCLASSSDGTVLSLHFANDYLVKRRIKRVFNNLAEIEKFMLGFFYARSNDAEFDAQLNMALKEPISVISSNGTAFLRIRKHGDEYEVYYTEMFE